MSNLLKLAGLLFCVPSIVLAEVTTTNADNSVVVIQDSGQKQTNLTKATLATESPSQDGYVSAYGISAQVGTLGLGINLTRALVSDYLNIRFQANYLQYNATNTGNQFKLNGNTYGLLLDYQPMGGIFRFTGGAYYNNRSLGATSSTIDLGNSFSGNGSAGVNYSQFAPYLGIGIGQQAASSYDKKGMIIGFDAGVLFQNPQSYANVTCTGSNCNPALFNQQLNQFRQDLQNAVNQYGKYYPVLSFSLGYRF